MAKRLSDFRPVFVVGIGLHPYQKYSPKPYVALGLAAIREAIADAGVEWPEIESAFVATALLGMAPGRPMLRHLGATGLAITHVENASASGSTAFRLAALEVASGQSDLNLAIGVDKPAMKELGARQNGLDSLERDRVAAYTHFALLAQKYADAHGATPEDFARVAVKNLANGAKNPYAQRRENKSLEEIVGAPALAGFLTPLQSCPIGEGAAATILASEEGIRRLGLDPRRAVRVLSSTLRSERLYEDNSGFDAALTEETTQQTLAEAGISPSKLDIVELHDAFSVEELLYIERMGLCDPGDAARRLKAGHFDIGGEVAVSPSGGLIAMGHPLGPTGLGQIVEITRQLRGEAEGRQHARARTGLAHMVGLGAVCVTHVLQRDA
jgi:acetyl-CoA acetyltransferase